MLANIKVETLMTKKVKTVNPFDLMTVVSDIFAMNKFNHIPVINEEEQLAGMISRKDFNKVLTTFSIFNIARAEADNRRIQKSIMVKDVMSKIVIHLHPNDPISMAFEIFKENLIHALPVMDDNNRIIGIITTFDLLNYAFENLEKT